MLHLKLQKNPSVKWLKRNPYDYQDQEKAPQQGAFSYLQLIPSLRIHKYGSKFGIVLYIKPQS